MKLSKEELEHLKKMAQAQIDGETLQMRTCNTFDWTDVPLTSEDRICSWSKPDYSRIKPKPLFCWGVKRNGNMVEASIVRQGLDEAVARYGGEVIKLVENPGEEK